MELIDWKILNKKVDILRNNYFKYKKQNIIDEEELRENVLDVLSWIEICIKDNKNDKGLISGFRFINNKKKHSTLIYDYNIASTALLCGNNVFPSTSLFPSEFMINWCFIDYPGNEEWKNQWKNYNKYLANKDVLHTIDDLLETINPKFNNF